MKFKLFLLTAVLSFNSFAAADFGNLSKAKAMVLSDDMAKMEYVEVDDSVLFEIDEESYRKGFSSKKVRAYDPVNKKRYQKVMVGETYKANALETLVSSYTHWRYVTVYNIEQLSERIAYLPYFEEDCHDSSFFMGQWGEARSMKVTLKTEVGGSVSYAGLGLSASVGMSIEQGVTFSTQRRVQAVEGLKARHYPYKLSENWKGVTYIQTYNAKKRTYGYLTDTASSLFFGGYPYKFFLDNQNVGLKVKRDVLATCENYNPSNDPLREEDEFLMGEFAN